MGQAVSTCCDSPGGDFPGGGISGSNLPRHPTLDFHYPHQIDHSSEIPDECLALVFQSLNSGDRKRSSIVCRRWYSVEAQSRYRLALNASAGLAAHLPSIFTRFESITKLTLRCDRRSVSIADDAISLISLRWCNLTRLKLRGCREISDVAMLAIATNCRSLRKFSCGSCTFGSNGMIALINNCSSLEELSVKRLRGDGFDAELIGPGAAASSLKSITLKDLYMGQCFDPLIIGSKNLKTLKIVRCLGEWDTLLESLTKEKCSLIHIHLERLQVSDSGLIAISKCTELEILHLVKAPDCSNEGILSVAEHCKLLRKLHIDGWRTNRIGDEGLIAIAENSVNLVELVLVGVNPSSVSLMAVASNCQKLERLALCGSETIGDLEISCIAAKCVALKRLCIKGCSVTDSGIEAFAFGCPNLVKIKVRKCRGVTSESLDWLRERRVKLSVNHDGDEVEPEVTMDASTGDENADGTSTSGGRQMVSKSRFSIFSRRTFVACAGRLSKGNGNFE